MQDPLKEWHLNFTSYSYVNDNSINFIDPFGLDTLDANTKQTLKAGDVAITENGTNIDVNISEVYCIHRQNNYYNNLNLKLQYDMLLSNTSKNLHPEEQGDKATTQKYNIDRKIWSSAFNNTNNVLGGMGLGLQEFGGTFRIYNSNGLSPKFYEVSKITGRGWGGGSKGLIKTYNSSSWGRGLGYGSLIVSLVMGGISISEAWQQDGNTYGINTKLAVAETSLGITGAWTGAEIGASIGVWFGGVGAIPGAIIGGVLGGWGGSKLGEITVITLSSH